MPAYNSPLLYRFMSFGRTSSAMQPKSPYQVESRETAPDDGLDETTPLLPPPSYSPHHAGEPDSSATGWRVPRSLVWTILIAVLCLSLGDQLMESPQTRIFEAIICYRYYETKDPSKILISREAIGPGAIGGVEEMYCKVGAVQDQLASLRGWQTTFDGIPVLLLAIPVGWAADRYGRKPIVIVGLVAVVLRASWLQLVTWFWQAFDVRVTWYSTIFASLGGGASATTNVFFVMLSDVTTDAKRAEAFVRIGAFNLLASVLMPPLAALLMEINPWIPNFAGTVLEFLTILIFLTVPETMNISQQSSSSTEPPPIPQLDSVQQSDAAHISTANQNAQQTFWRYWASKTKQSTSFLFHDWRVIALIMPFSIHFLMGAIGQLLLQYVSTRYEVKISKAIIITTVRSGFVTLLLFTILPYISKLMIQRYRFTPQRRDLWLARVSLIFIAVGWLLTGLAPNIVLVIISFAISSLGLGMGALLRSSVTYLIEKHHIARVYAVISVVDTVGMMTGSPAMARLFKRGLESGGDWLGLPFFLLALVAACFAVLLSAVHVRKGEDLDTGIEEA